MFPGYLILDLAKYCNSQEGRFAKIGMFVVLSPIFGFSALVWFGLWALIVGLELEVRKLIPMSRRRFPPPWTVEHQGRLTQVNAVIGFRCEAPPSLPIDRREVILP